jgi:zinc protease
MIPKEQSMELVSQHPFGAGGLMAKKFRLANGLKVILVRDPSAPVFAYQTWFAVGSRHEREGITGIAHLFEHLMFNQTESHPPGELDRMIESAGGDTNAATWVDWTYYRDNLPRAELALAVDLEADRMAHLVLGETQVESEREVVANERRFRVEDDVDGFLNEELYKLAFSKHPYHWPTIGWMRDIEAITIEDCRAFYRTYYAPNNATVVLVGDVDEDEALKLIEQRYGGIAAQEIPVDGAVAEPEQTEERRASYGKPITADKLRIGYKAPPLGHADYAVLEVVSEILFGGNSSRLHRRLVVDGEIASSTHASTAPFRDPGLYEISVSLQRGHGAAEAEAIVYEELERLVKEPLQPHELDTAKTRLLTHFMRELRPSSGKAEALGHYETTIGDYRKLFAVADGYRAVTAPEIERVVGHYLTAARRTVVLGVPSTKKGQS